MTPTASRRERRKAWRASRNHPDRVGSQAWRRNLQMIAFFEKQDLDEYNRLGVMPEPGKGTHDDRTKAWRSEWR